VSFAVATQAETFGGGGGGTIASVTTGVGSSTGRFGDYQFWGYSTAGGVFNSFWGPDTSIGSISPSPATFRSYVVAGVYSCDNGAGGTNAGSYFVVLAGTAASGTVNTLTIDSTPLTANTLSIITGYQPGYTIFRFSLTTPAANLFGTSGSHTVALT